MLRSTFLIFIAGWIAWLWIDKPDPRQFRMPESSDSMLENFQIAFDMLKAGYLDISFVYLWSAHYLVLSLLGGALLAVISGAFADQLARRRMRRHFLPPVRQQARAADSVKADPDGRTVEQDPPAE